MKIALGRLLLGVLGSLLFASYALAGVTVQAPHTANQVLVKFKDDAFFDPETNLGEGAKVLHRYDSGALLVEIPTSFVGIEAFIDNLQENASSDIEYVEPNYILHANLIPNDSLFKNMYGLDNQGTRAGSVKDADIDAPEAWDITVGSKNVVVGVIDTGIDCSHVDLVSNCAFNKGEVGLDALRRDKRTNGVDDDGNGYIDDFRGWDFANNDNNPFDDQGHGTHVSGTIGATANNRMGTVGVSHQVSLIGMKFLDASGSGTLDAAVRAIEYSTRLGVTMTSNSWGGGGYSQTLEAAIKSAQAKGILFIAAAGNESNNNDLEPSYPASYKVDNIISVAATDAADRLAWFSNVGKTSVHLAAPGVNILSTFPGNRYGEISGTSMATPHVSGVAALIKAKYPNASYQEIKRRLLQGVDKVPALADKTFTGGRLNAANSLKLP